MSRFISIFLPRIVKTIIKAGVNNVTFGFGGDLLIEAAEAYVQGATPESNLAELQDIVQHPTKFSREVEAAVADQLPEVSARTRIYFAQLPGVLQKSLRRTQDPSGRTLPENLPLSSASDFLRLIPVTMPRFNPGDCPVPGTDLELTDFIGRGGFGEVWRAKHLDRPSSHSVVLKFCIEEKAARSLKNEVRMLDLIQTRGKHPNIVQLIYPHLRCDPPCLEYEYVEGGDLAQFLDDGGRESLTPIGVMMLILNIAETVGFAHRFGIVHRDLKPQNILVSCEGDKFNYKITDFGIGGILQSEEIKQFTDPVEGSSATLSRGSYTPLYSSPQQQKGGLPDMRDDVYALGVMWFQLLVCDLTKEAPRGKGWKLRLAAKGASGDMLDLIEACLESDSDDRIRDAGELVVRIQKILRPIPKIRSKWTSRFWKVRQLNLDWAEVIKRKPHRNIVMNVDFRNRILKSGFPWHVMDKNSGIEMLLVPEGTFLMGTALDSADAFSITNPQHPVIITQPFYLGRTPVTQAIWEKIMKSNLSAFKGLDNPIETISWQDCQGFCGRTGLRLPTEAEWEYACRGGDAISQYGTLDDFAWNATNALDKTHVVASKLPNALGFYDMLGNVWEWTQDWWGSYSVTETHDPIGPLNGLHRIIRGGGWNSGRSQCREWFRSCATPDFKTSTTGFRVARSP